MVKTSRRWLVVAMGVIAIYSFANHAAMAQSFPSKPIRLLTLFAAGSTGDTSARLLPRPLAMPWGSR